MAKAARAADARQLTDIPNIGPALARELQLAGIAAPAQLKRKSAFNLYQHLNLVTAKRCDLCVLDTFMAAVDFMNGGMPRPWWDFTAERKRRHPGI